ncbi:Scr1 family TA system antitoxin-like transcriptional regulator [Streptomyces sp. NPDC059452]|uniref:helix-turn-helix domain-containing protein n=1 Tax=Streptomyces sp. NPDC059452 TaxID=3346835 RepID=UPI0036A3E186
MTTWTYSEKPDAIPNQLEYRGVEQVSEKADQGNQPANAARYFGEEVKALREALGLAQEPFATELRYKQAQVSKVENGHAFASEDFAAAMDKLAGTPGVYARLRARLSRRGGHPEWFVPYVTLEESASAVTDYSCTFLMGLLQTPDYATAVFRSHHPRESEDQIRSRVETRLLRRKVLERVDPPLLWVVAHEAVLCARVGGRAVMIAQLEHLAALMATPHVTVQVLPFEVGAAPSHLPFTLLSKNGTSHAVYTETATQGGQVDEAASVVGAAVSMFDRLRMHALNEEESLTRLHKIMEGHRA